MNSNTNCKVCCFSDVASSTTPCQLHIIDQVKNTKDIIVKDDYYYINNYRCKYGFSKEQLDKHPELFKDIDLIDYIKTKQLVSYYLIIDYRSSNTSIEDIANYINKLEIKPKFISILLYETELAPIVNILNEKLDKSLKWKTHNFLTKDTSLGLAIKTTLDTSKILKESNYLWIVDSADLKRIADGNSILDINRIINIDQPLCNALKCENIEPISGLFINTQTYMYITHKVHQFIDEGIKIIPNFTTINYA